MLFLCMACSLTLKMEVMCSFKTSIAFHQITCNYILENRILRNYCQDSSVYIVTGYELAGCGSILGIGKIFLFSTVYRPDVGPTQFPIQCVQGALSVGVKQHGCKTGHSPPSSAGAKNDGSIPHVSSWHSAEAQGQLYLFFSNN
jgi:hypothetical protein